MPGFPGTPVPTGKRSRPAAAAAKKEQLMATTYNNLYLDIRRRLRGADVGDPSLEARELVCFATGKSREEFYRDGGLYASPEIEQRTWALVREVLKRSK